MLHRRRRSQAPAQGFALMSMHVVFPSAVQCSVCVQIAVAHQQLDGVRAHRGSSDLPPARMHST